MKYLLMIVGLLAGFAGLMETSKLMFGGIVLLGGIILFAGGAIILAIDDLRESVERADRNMQTASKAVIAARDLPAATPTTPPA